MQLRDYLTSTDQKPEQFAAAHGFPIGTLKKWIRRERTPRRDAMKRIGEATRGKVTPDDFFDAPDRSHAA